MASALERKLLRSKVPMSPKARERRPRRGLIPTQLSFGAPLRTVLKTLFVQKHGRSVRSAPFTTGNQTIPVICRMLAQRAMTSTLTAPELAPENLGLQRTSGW